MFGHKGVLIKIGDPIYFYFFGGRSPDAPDGVNNELWRFVVPYTPIAFCKCGNLWEKVTLKGDIPKGVYGHAMIVDGTTIYMYGGADASGTANSDIYIINPLTNTSTRLKYTSPDVSITTRVVFDDSRRGTARTARCL